MPYKGSANQNNMKQADLSWWFSVFSVRIEQSLLERTAMFFRLLYGTFWFTKVRCCMAVCYIWPDLHHRVVSSTAPSFDGVPNFHFFEMDVLYAFKAFLNEFSGVLILKTLKFSKCNVSFATFSFSLLKFACRCWTLKLNLNMLSVSFLFLFSFTYSQSMNRALVGMWRLTTRVRVTLFHLREVIYLCI